jgi:Na+/H+ antiporter NhaD/arsenite permease-like protein
MLINDDFRPTLGVILVIITLLFLLRVEHVHLTLGEFLHITDMEIIIFLAAMMLIFWAIEGDLFIFLRNLMAKGKITLRNLVTKLALISGILSALIDEVDAIILPVLIILALLKEEKLTKKMLPS